MSEPLDEHAQDPVCRVVAALSDPLLTRFDNPFFKREMRQFSRLRSGILYVVLLCLGFMLLLLLSPFLADLLDSALTRRPPAIYQRMLLIAAIPHAILCFMAGTFGTSRMYAVEDGRNTLLFLLLLPYEPARWLSLRLAFPAYLIVVAWLVPVPCYFLTAYLESVSLWACLHIVMLPLLAGFAGILTILLFTRDYLREELKAGQILTEDETSTDETTARSTPEADEERTLTPRTQIISSFASSNDLLRLLLLCAFIVALVLSVFMVPTSWGEVWRFYDMFAPAAMLWIVVYTAVAIAAFFTGMASLSRDEWARQSAVGIRWAAVVTIYYTALGFWWHHLHGIVTWVYLLAPVFSMISGRVLLSFIAWIWPRKNQESLPTHEAPPERAETLWIAARWDNPLLIKDLRASTRTLSLRRIIVLDFLLLICLYFVFMGIVHFFRPTGGLGGLSSGLWIYINGIAMQAGNTSAAMWQKEAKGATLLHLFLTPLTSREILRGRLMAGVIRGWIARMPSVLALCGAIVWICLKGFWFASIMAIIALPLLWSINFWVGSNIPKSHEAGESAAQPEVDLAKDSDKTPIRIFIGIVHFGSLMCCMALGGFGAMASPWLSWPLALFLLAVNITLVKASVHIRIRELDILRRVPTSG